MVRRRTPGLLALLAALLLLVSAPLALADAGDGAGQDPPESTTGGGALAGQDEGVSPDGWSDWTVRALTLLLQVTVL